MKLDIDPGKYVVAVSGGVDSVVLLDILSKLSGLDLTVAHYDHGIRKDSKTDRKLVEKLAKDYRLKFRFTEGKLGDEVSEAEARVKRYEFLNTIKVDTKARAIVTAHHQDDLIETAVINLMRGTNRRGLSSLYSSIIERPLIPYSKAELINYAKLHNLVWREDESNTDPKYLRNFVRLNIIPKLSRSERAKLLAIIGDSRSSNKLIDTILAELIKAHSRDNKLKRTWFIGLPHNIAREVMAYWLRQQSISLDKTSLERLVVAAKTLAPLKGYDISNRYRLSVQADYLALLIVER